MQGKGTREMKEGPCQAQLMKVCHTLWGEEQSQTQVKSSGMGRGIQVRGRCRGEVACCLVPVVAVVREGKNEGTREEESRISIKLVKSRTILWKGRNGFMNGGRGR